VTRSVHVPTWGLLPEELIDRSTNKATGNEISTAMGQLIKLIHDELRLTIPEYESLSFEEIKSLVTLNGLWGDFDPGTYDDFMYPAFVVLLSKIPEPKIYHLTQAMKVVRVVVEMRYPPFSVEKTGFIVEFSHSISNILDQSGIKPDREKQHPF